MCVRSGPGVNQSQIVGGVPQTAQAGLKYWPCNSSSSTVVLLVPSTVSFVLERLLQNASKLHNSQRLKPIVQNSYISNSYVPYYKSNCSPVLFSLHPLFLTHRLGEHRMVLALSLDTPESSRPCFTPLAVKGCFPWLPCHESPWWMSGLSDVILITLGKNKLVRNSVEILSLEKIRMVFYFTTSFLAKTHSSFLSLLFNYKSLVFSPLPSSANTFHLVFPLLSIREKLGTHILDSFGHYRSKEKERSHMSFISGFAVLACFASKTHMSFNYSWG